MEVSDKSECHKIRKKTPFLENKRRDMMDGNTTFRIENHASSHMAPHYISRTLSIARTDLLKSTYEVR